MDKKVSRTSWISSDIFNNRFHMIFLAVFILSLVFWIITVFPSYFRICCITPRTIRVIIGIPTKIVIPQMFSRKIICSFVVFMWFLERPFLTESTRRSVVKNFTVVIGLQSGRSLWAGGRLERLPEVTKIWWWTPEGTEKTVKGRVATNKLRIFETPEKAIEPGSWFLYVSSYLIFLFLIW